VLEDGCISHAPRSGELQVLTVFDFAPDFFCDCRAGKIFFHSLGRASGCYPDGHASPPCFFDNIFFVNISGKNIFVNISGKLFFARYAIPRIPETSYLNIDKNQNFCIFINHDMDSKSSRAGHPASCHPAVETGVSRHLSTMKIANSIWI
jgi:hypothetical protein